MLNHKSLPGAIFVTLFTLGLFLGLATPAPTVQASTQDSTPFIFNQGLSFAPHTDGRWVIWGGSGGPNDLPGGIYGVNLADGKVFPVVTGPTVGFQADIDNGVVVWEQDEPCPSCKREIYAKNLATGKVIDLGLGFNPRISGSYVIYLGGPTNGGEGIQLRDISTMAPPVTLAQPNYPPSSINSSYSTINDCLVIDGNRVLWSEEYIDTERVGHFNLYTIRIGESSPTLIDQGIGNRITCDLHNDTIVYTVYMDVIKLVNLATRERRDIGDYNLFPGNSAPIRAYDPQTDGRYIFFEESPIGADYTRLDLAGYDIATNSFFGVDTDGNKNNSPNFKNGVLTWLKGPNKTGDEYNQVRANYLSALLPTAPQTSVSSTSDRYYFNDTDHTLAYGFKNFWDKNGALAVFGFPQTEEFQELNPDTGKFYTVQYFERQRYEYHLENAGTPYEVLLGRLGVTEAKRRNLLNTTPFQKVAATSAGDTKCLYFTETGHKVCGGFLNYWHSHGLDLGDTGTSYRESLALFGLPISEEFTDTQTGLTTQYFERAKFEYHPENKGTPYEVLLGLLGNQELAIRNWS